MSETKKRYKGNIEEANISDSALFINEGKSSPPNINPLYLKKRKPRTILSVDDYISGIKSGNINILSRAITLIESKQPAHYDIAQEIVSRCISLSGNSLRIGITGVPGAGKSTFIESLGMEILSHGYKLAVLAIDPSSERSGGSILGDKTRMENLSTQNNAFIRPSPSAGSLGGVARKTRESLILCEAAGFNIIFIETVGVGQSETAVHSMVDFFLLLMLAGAGDELQGIKRGIMEMADAIAITKADGNNEIKAKLAKVQYQNALNLFPLTQSQWKPEALTCSAIENKGISDIWQLILKYEKFTKDNLYFNKNRQEQSKYWLYETLNQAIKDNFYSNNEVKLKLKELESKIINNTISSFNAANEIINLYLKK